MDSIIQKQAQAAALIQLAQDAKKAGCTGLARTYAAEALKILKSIN